jgi:hypothetical protein
MTVFGKVITYIIRNISRTELYEDACVLEFHSHRLRNVRSVPVEVGFVAQRFRIPGLCYVSVSVWGP